MIFRKRSQGTQETGSQPPPPLLRCSFCNKSERDAKELVAGPRVYICDECVDICNDIIAEDRGIPGPSAVVREMPKGVEGVVLESPPAVVRPVLCKLCGSISVVEFCLPVAGRGWICGTCLDAVKEVLDASSPES